MPETQSITIRLPVPMHEHLRREAFEQRTSINALIVKAIAEKHDLAVPDAD